MIDVGILIAIRNSKFARLESASRYVGNTQLRVECELLKAEIDSLNQSIKIMKDE